MRSIKKLGFSADYYLTEQGLIYNARSRKYIEPYSDHSFKLKNQCGMQKTISLKNLYRKVYNKEFCIDNIQNLEKEIWKPIQDTNYYFVSNFARVKSYKGYESKLLKPWMNKKENGYYLVKLTINGITKNHSLHRLVAEAFKQKPKQNIQNYQVHHKDFNRCNNIAQNLQYLTKEAHKKKHEQKKVIQ